LRKPRSSDPRRKGGSMCGRYIHSHAGEVPARVACPRPPTWADGQLQRRSNSTSADRARASRRARFAVVRWGLSHFSPKASRGSSAPSTLALRPSRPPPLTVDRGGAAQRCLQLASGFYEWHVDEYGRKAPYLITVADQELFGFAALWTAALSKTARWSRAACISRCPRTRW